MISASFALASCLSTAAFAAPTIPELAVSAGRFQTLVTAVQAADLVETLNGDGPFTVFAPTDEAFSKIDPETIQSLLAEPGRESLRRILAHHVVAGRLDAATLIGRDEVQTLAGTTLPLEVVRNRLLVGDAAVETADLDAANGVVHVIDRVLLPPAPASPLRSFLERALERGVPLFNDGDPAACAAVYATALEAVAASEGWGLDQDQRSNLTSALRTVADMPGGEERAWGYRRIIDDLWRGMASESGGGSAPASVSSSRTIFDFDDPSSLRRWNIVLDGVMGGLSTGRVTPGPGTLRFTGETSLRNNGGFSSMRAAVAAGTMDDFDALKLRVKGDGRTWIVGTRSGSGMGADSYWTRFPTTDGEWTEVIVPIADMEHHFFGERIPGRIRPEQVRGIEFYMYDKKAGPFSLEIDRIEAVNLDG